MTARVRREDVIPNLPVPSNPRAHVCVVLSLNYPDMDDKEAELVKSFTRRALSTLIELGASFDLWDRYVETFLDWLDIPKGVN